MEYDFECDGVEVIESMLRQALQAAATVEEKLASRADDVSAQRPRFDGAFKSIALACHGPPHDEVPGAQETFEWKISQKIVICDDKEILTFYLSQTYLDPNCRNTAPEPLSMNHRA